MDNDTEEMAFQDKIGIIFGKIGLSLVVIAFLLTIISRALESESLNNAQLIIGYIGFLFSIIFAATIIKKV